jgi:hypothetical protein
VDTIDASGSTVNNLSCERNTAAITDGGSQGVRGMTVSKLSLQRPLIDRKEASVSISQSGQDNDND